MCGKGWSQVTGGLIPLITDPGLGFSTDSRVNPHPDNLEITGPPWSSGGSHGERSQGCRGGGSWAGQEDPDHHPRLPRLPSQGGSQDRGQPPARGDLSPSGSGGEGGHRGEAAAGGGNGPRAPRSVQGHHRRTAGVPQPDPPRRAGVLRDIAGLPDHRGAAGEHVRIRPPAVRGRGRPGEGDRRVPGADGRRDVRRQGGGDPPPAARSERDLQDEDRDHRRDCGERMTVIGADTIQWEDEAKGDYVMYRVPRNVRYNDNVVVREDEYLVFFRDGKALHVFDRPGRYALTTQNVPVLASIVKGLTGVQQIGEIIYLQKRELRGKFGTKEPLTFRDRDFGLVRLRMFGQFSYKVRDPLLFITQFVGAMGYSHSQEVIDWMKDQIVMILNDILGELKRDKDIGVADLPAYLEEIEQMILARIHAATARYGLEVMKVVGININLPEEVQEAVDARSSMGILGANYMQYQALLSYLAA
ncbi:MAG TPA: SPFH domain-containing protein, partial [Thermoplasmata archaeon]|nr:SPFH domain-containing protein [Thermoplasmata archaeon]